MQITSELELNSSFIQDKNKKIFIFILHVITVPTYIKICSVEVGKKNTNFINHYQILYGFKYEVLTLIKMTAL